MRKGGLLAMDQIDQCIRSVTSRVDLLYPERCGDIGQTPGMNMEHGCDGHIHIALIETAVAGSGQRRLRRHCVQNKLPMTETHSLWKPRRAGGVEGRGVSGL